jgi:hypothetical protein
VETKPPVPTLTGPALTPGRQVHYVLEDDAVGRKGEVRPATVVAVRNEDDRPNLMVLLDGANDAAWAGSGNLIMWRSSVGKTSKEERKPGCWFWPERT